MCRDMSPTSKMRAEVQRMTGLLFKGRQTNEVIDLQSLFEVYWDSNIREFTIPSQSWMTYRSAHF